MHEHISPLLGEHPHIVNILLGPETVHYREVSLYSPKKLGKVGKPGSVDDKVNKFEAR